ncbi:MAG: ATP-binding protein [Verrucomicrobiae bacterium]
MPNNSILIAADAPEILEFYRKILPASPAPEFDVPGASGSAQAPPLTCHTFSDPLKLLEEYGRTVKSGERHPLCLIDMRMPVLSGLAAAIRLREIDPEINVVICTALPDVSLDEIRSKLQPGIYFVRKPFVAEEFSLLVHSLVGHWNTQLQLKRTQAALAAQCEKLGQVLEATRVGTWEWDIPTGKVEFNERWAEIVGYELRELGPVDIATWTRLSHPADLAQSNAMLDRVFAGELEYYDFECRMRHKNGSWIWVRDRGKVASWSPEGKPLRMSGTRSDITEKHRAGEIRSRLISMASHEFRTPLSSIRLAADLLSSCLDKMDEKDIQWNLNTILETTDYLTSIVTDVLDLSSLGQTSKAMSEIPLGDFLRQITEEYRFAMTDPSALTLEWNGAPVSCMGVPSLLKRAVNNLLDNAVKYSPAGKPIVLRLQQEEMVAVIQVEDEGIGIPKDDVQSLHEAFFRASNSAGIPGAGLGLAMASEALHRMAGGIEHANRAGGGSIFTIRLPLAP